MVCSNILLMVVQLLSDTSGLYLRKLKRGNIFKIYDKSLIEVIFIKCFSLSHKLTLHIGTCRIQRYQYKVLTYAYQQSSINKT